ncbi:hypothetical protein D3C75_950630 [compost metagenome]
MAERTLGRLAEGPNPCEHIQKSSNEKGAQSRDQLGIEVLHRSQSLVHLRGQEVHNLCDFGFELLRQLVDSLHRFVDDSVNFAAYFGGDAREFGKNN